MPQLGFMLGADPSMSIVSRLFTCAVSDVIRKSPLSRLLIYISKCSSFY